MSTLSLVHSVRPRAEANPAGERPRLLILLHGVGSNEASMAPLVQAFDPRFVVVNARSPIALGPGSYAWFHVTFGPKGPSIVPGEAESGWQHIARFVDEAVTEYGADPARVYIAGFSQGAIMAIATMLTSPERLAGVVAMSGRLLPEVLPQAVATDRLRDKKMLIVHGTAEQVLGIQFGRSAREQLSRLPFELTYREMGMGHTITLESCGVVSAWLSAALNSWIGIPPRATTTAPSTESPDTH